VRIASKPSPRRVIPVSLLALRRSGTPRLDHDAFLPVIPRRPPHFHSCVPPGDVHSCSGCFRTEVASGKSCSAFRLPDTFDLGHVIVRNDAHGPSDVPVALPSPVRRHREGILTHGRPLPHAPASSSSWPGHQALRDPIV